MTDLRLGAWQEVLADVQCDALICDPPYAAATHAGHDNALREGGLGEDLAERRTLNYAALSPADVRALVDHWQKHTSGWLAIMSCSRLAPVYREAFDAAGMVSFCPVVCVIRGMTVRLAGDGPSSWAIYLNVARHRTKEMAGWGTLNGAYVVGRGAMADRHIGGKPIDLMSAIVRDYSKPGDLVCDPFSGTGTTAIAAEGLGRRFVGSEVDPETHAKAIKRIAKGVQMDMFGGAA